MNGAEHKKKVKNWYLMDGNEHKETWYLVNGAEQMETWYLMDGAEQNKTRVLLAGSGCDGVGKNIQTLSILSSFQIWL